MTLQEYFQLPDVLSQVSFAAALGVHPSQLSQWIRRVNGRVPGPHYCIRIEQLTGGAVTCEELHPDAGWQRLKSRALGFWRHHPNGFPVVNPLLAAVH